MINMFSFNSNVGKDKVMQVKKKVFLFFFKKSQARRIRKAYFVSYAVFITFQRKNEQYI